MAAASVSSWLQRFASRNGGDVESLFAEECYWRDLVALTWNLKTVEGRKAIAELAAAAPLEATKDWKLQDDAEDVEDHLEAWLSFATASCRCVGHVRLRQGKCWTLFTAAEEILSHPDPRGPARSLGRPYGALKGRVPLSHQQAAQKAALGATEQPFVAIVGGGQCGLSLGARLTRLGVPTLILDKHPRAGDCWRNRYDCLHLHDPVFLCHLPHLPMPDHWPLWAHKDQMADWLEIYVQALGLNYWPSTTCLSASWDAASSQWVVKVDRAGEQLTLRPAHLVLATGLYGGPSMPKLEGTEEFKGEVFHSSCYQNGKRYAGKRAVVVGSNTSAHDIAEDLWESGAKVTMVQRSPTMVVHIDTQLETVSGLYDDAAVAKGISTEKADLISASFPFKLVTEAQRKRCREIREKDADYYKKLEAAGFRLDFGEDETGNIMMFLRRGCGYYFDTGASDLIIKGEVSVRPGDVQRLTPRGLRLADGTEVEADLVIFATGYQPLNDTVEQFLGPEVTGRLGAVWGLGSGSRGDPGPWEGELRNMWKPTAVENLWVQGGNLSFSRIYSKYLALQLQARFLQLPTPVL